MIIKRGYQANLIENTNILQLIVICFLLLIMALGQIYVFTDLIMN